MLPIKRSPMGTSDWWEYPNHYNRLGVKQTADLHAIRRAYKAKVLKYLPDKQIGYLCRNQAIDQAFAVLRNPASRKDHDESLARKEKYWSTRTPTHFTPFRSMLGDDVLAVPRCGTWDNHSQIASYLNL